MNRNDYQHPSKDIQGSKGNLLRGKKIVLCITGSVAAVKSVEIARELMRQGAEIIPVMSSSACRFIHPDMVHWATGTPVITELTGYVEHVAYAGNVPDKANLILIAPATANTIGKIAAGIDDTTVTTFATTALGEGIPMIIVPAMHEPMYRHPIVLENIEKLKSIDIRFVIPEPEEGKLKIAGTTAVVEEVIKKLVYTQDFAGKKLLVTAGRTLEYLDPVRILTNKSSGKMGMAICREAMRRGAEVTLIYGQGSAPVPEGVNLINVETASEMKEAVHREIKAGGYHIFIAAAAVGDWTPETAAENKISTHDKKSLDIRLVPTPKIIDGIKKIDSKIFLVAFRAITNLTDDGIIENAFTRLEKAGADMIAANDTSRNGAGFDVDTNELFIINKSKEITPVPLMSKDEAAKHLLNEILKNYKN